jgi:hypothetical protein
MKKIKLRVIVFLMLMVVVSCDEPDTVVTNIIHIDGSVTRKIEMRNSKNKFEKTDLQVPFDSTWTLTDSYEVSPKGDTTWIKRAEKLFKNVEAINLTYHNDSSINGKIARRACLIKKFRWFNTEYRFSEIVGDQLSGYPLTDYLNNEEREYFYSPEYIKFNKEHGPDSIHYRKMSDTIKLKTDQWTIKNVASLWLNEFSRLTGPKAGPELSKASLMTREGEFIEIINENQDKFDSLWAKGVLLRKFIGDEDAVKFKTEADSALTLVFNRIFIDFRDYSLRIVMPGKLTGTNGYIDSTRNLLWPVKSDFFITDQYEMWAESKTPNLWAWVVSGIFLVFIFTGIIIKKVPSANWRTGLKP